MIKIIVCNRCQDSLNMIFDEMRNVLSQSKISCDLSISKDISKIEQSLNNDIYAYDVIVLDASEEKHLLLAEELRKKNFYVSLVFLISPADRTDILKYRPTAVISSPSNSRQILYALKNCMKEQQYARPYFIVKNRDMIMRISFNDIVYFESRKRVVVLYTSNGVIEFYAKLTDLLPRLPSDMFVRCHRSYIVNIKRMHVLDKTEHCFITDMKQRIDISKNYFQDMTELFSSR